MLKTIEIIVLLILTIAFIYFSIYKKGKLDLLILLLIIFVILIKLQSKRIEYYNNENEVINDLKTFAFNILPELKDKITINIGKSSLTEGKKHIFICIYDEYKNIYNKDILYNVLLHELAHVISPTISGTSETIHDEIHYKNLVQLNEIAKSKGYLNINFNVVPMSYCIKKR